MLLFLIAALAVGGCMLASSHTSTEDEFLAFIAVQLVLALLFAGLGLWARRNPLGGSVTGLVVYFGIHLLMAVFDPSSLTQGMALHLIVIALLGRAIFGGIKYRELAKRRGWET